jgi:RNA polymerase sigma factor (sigma-70 family)
MSEIEDQKAIEEHFDIILYQAAKLYNAVSSYELEDLIQVGYIATIKAARNYDSEKGEIKPYVFSCVKNHLIRFLKKESFWNSKVTLGFSDFYDKRNKKEVTEDLKDTIENHSQNLPTIERRIISLKSDGYTRREICDILLLSKKEYYGLFFSAVNKIRKYEN